MGFLPPMEGECRCGQVRFRITAQPMFTAVCHCRGCQRMSGSAFSLTVAVPEIGLQVLGGELVVGGAHGSDVHQHCARCKSWMFTRPAGAAGMVNVRATMLDDPSPFEPFLETCTAEKLPWCRSPRHSYPGFPPMEDFGRLLAEFARGWP